MSDPLVSVIIPTYNRLNSLREAVKSVLKQTYRNVELIVVDDCSDDGTQEWCESEKQILYHRMEQRSYPSISRNRGVETSEGEYVAFLDSDDSWKKKKLGKQVQFFSENPGIRICHTDEQWVRNGKKVNEGKRHRKEGGDIFKRSLELCLISPSAVIMEASLYMEFGGFDEELEVGEDYHLWLRITDREHIGFIPEKLTIKNGGHDDQLSAKYGQIEIFRINALEKVIEEGNLTEEHMRQALEVYREKCRVYAIGCRKRGRLEEAVLFEKKAGLPGSNQ